jgi:hypothetical protein
MTAFTFRRDVIAGDDVLRRNLEGLLAQRNAHHAVDRSKNQNHARALGCDQAAKTEDDAALIFSQNLDGTEQVDDDDDDENGDQRKAQYIHNASRISPANPRFRV